MLNHIESEEKKRIDSNREFKMPDYRTGDILDVTLFTSLSEGKFNTFRGVCFAKKQVNNMRAAFKINTVVDDVNTSIMVKTCSPMLAKVEVVAYGSNKNRKKLNHIPALELPKNRLLEPIRKGKGFKHRDECGSSQKKQNQSNKVDVSQKRGKARRDSIKLDRPENY